jgi:hypothetical protein
MSKYSSHVCVPLSFDYTPAVRLLFRVHVTTSCQNYKVMPFDGDVYLEK